MELKEIELLIKAISKFPGLGPKSAKRIILKLINNKDEMKMALGIKLLSEEVKEKFRERLMKMGDFDAL